MNFPTKINDNISGVTTFKFIEVEGVNSINLHPLTNKITEEIDINPLYSWSNGYACFDTLKYSEVIKNNKHGTYLEITLEGFIFDDQEINQLFSKMLNNRYILHIKDNNNIERIIGTISQPLTFLYEFDTETIKGDKGYNYKFTALVSKKPPIYDLNSCSSTSDSSTS